MKRKTRKKRSVGANNYSVSNAVTDTAMTGVEVLGGFMLAEFAANQLGMLFPSINTSLYRTGVKAVGATGTAVFAFSKIGKPYRKDILKVAGGMAANAVASGVKPSLPSNIASLIPSVNGVSGIGANTKYRKIRGTNQSQQTVIVA